MLNSLVSDHGASYGTSTASCERVHKSKHDGIDSSAAPAFTYSLWYGGSGAFAHAAKGGTCKSYFDFDDNSRESFLSHQPNVPAYGALESILKDPDDFVKHTRNVNYIHVTPPCTSYTRGGNQMGLHTRDGKQMLKNFDLLALVPEVPMVGVENVSNFWQFEEARTAFIARAQKLGYEVRRSTMCSGHFGSVQALRKRLYIMLVKPDYENQRARWSKPSRGKAVKRSVADILSASNTDSLKLAQQSPVVTVTPKQAQWYEGPTPVSILSNAPHSDPFHSENRGYRVYDVQGTAATITTTSNMAPGGATQLYRDTRFGTDIIRQLSVKEAWEVMGKPFPIDTSESRREIKLKLLGQSEDGYLARVWAKAVMDYSRNKIAKVQYMHESKLDWTREEAHARCMHLSDWCAGLLGLKPLKEPCKECALAGIRRSHKSHNMQPPVPSKNYRWGCDIVGKMRPHHRDAAPQYALVVIDYHTNYVWFKAMDTKSETLSAFKKIIAEAKAECRPNELEIGCLGEQESRQFLSGALQEYCDRKNIPLRLRTDADKIFKSQAFCKFCEQNDTDIEYSSPGDQFFNGKVERVIGTLKVKMFTVLKAAGMASSYWPDALAHCVYTYNRMPTKANPDYLSPYHMYRGKAPRLKHLRAFGCDCTYWAAKSMTNGSGRSGVFLGYTPKSPDGTYRIGVQGKRAGTMVDSRHVIFHESQVLPKFVDKTSRSHIKSEVDDLIQQHPPPADTSRHVANGGGNKSKHDRIDVKVTKTKRKFQVQDLVDDTRVLTPGENFHPKNGNRAKYIADRLQMLLGLTPTQSTNLKYNNSKGEVKRYRYEDCKYDLNQGYLQLASSKSEEGRAAVHVAEWLTPKTGTLTEAVTNKIHLINQET